MAKKLHGMLNLDRIPRELIGTNKNGEKIIWVDILGRDGEDKYGNTHTVGIYDKENRKSVYIGNLKEMEFGKSDKPKDDLF